MRNNSFLDSDARLNEKYLSQNKNIDYQTLVKLNHQVKDENTKLKRILSFKQELMKRSIFI